MQRLSLELAASLLAHPERRADLGVRLRLASDPEPAHEDLAVARRDELEHRPHLAAGPPIVEPAPRIPPVGGRNEGDQGRARPPHPRVEGRRDAPPPAPRPPPPGGGGRA